METRSLVSTVEDVVFQLERFEEQLNSTSLLPPDSILALNASLNMIEETFASMEYLVANATLEVEELGEMSAVLTEKYINLQLHRDLLRDMRDNLDKLDCGKEFV